MDKLFQFMDGLNEFMDNLNEIMDDFNEWAMFLKELKEKYKNGEITDNDVKNSFTEKAVTKYSNFFKN